jgi:hypothetical protein
MHTRGASNPLDGFSATDSAYVNHTAVKEDRTGAIASGIGNRRRGKRRIRSVWEGRAAIAACTTRRS